MTNQIKAIRKSRGLTQQDVADALGCTTTAICYYEQEKRECDYTTLCRLADLLNVTTDALLGREAIPTNQPTTEGGKHNMITLNDLLTIVDARQLRIVVPVTPRLKARITVNTRQTAELDDIIALYGERPVFSAEPTHEGNVMEIELTDRAEVAKREASL
jgi:transcriptional regulator with XRE-family HTH domain